MSRATGYLGMALAFSEMGRHEPMIYSEPNNPIFHPKKHTVQTYRSQQRAAKKRSK